MRCATMKGWGENATYTLKTLPKKKDLPLKATSKDAEMHLSDAYVKFTNATKTLVWDVSENNRAVEHAHDHWFAKLVFEALGKITWTRNSGGKIIGNDEYNRDAGREYEGGGGSYTVGERRSPCWTTGQPADRRRGGRRGDSFTTYLLILTGYLSFSVHSV